MARLGKHSVNGASENGSWAHDCEPLPVLINESKVGTQRMPVIASSCQIKFLTVLSFSVNRI